MLPVSTLFGESSSAYTTKDRKRINPFLLCSMKYSSANNNVRKDRMWRNHTHDRYAWEGVGVGFEMDIASPGTPKETRILNICMTISKRGSSLTGVITFGAPRHFWNMTAPNRG